MRIISLEAENVKCLKAISIKFDEAVLVIGGDNEQGKSTILDCIEYAMCGSKKIPPKPIRNGQDKARIVLELDDIIVTRTFTKNGTNLVVKNKDGATFPSPQALLDKLIGNLSFDPLAFSKMDSKKQIETLKKITGLDFDSLNKDYKKFFDERTEVNRKGKELKAQFDAITFTKDLQDKEVSVSDLSKELTDALEQNQKIDELEKGITKKTIRIKEIEVLIKSLEEEKSNLRKELKSDNEKLESFDICDINIIKNKLSSIEDTNKKIRENQKKKALEKELEKLREKSQLLSEKLLTINETKKELLSNAKFPVEGLSFEEVGDETILIFEGLPFSQCSTARQIRISVGMGLALNPSLKLLFIREGSLLDPSNLKIISEMAEEAKAQILIERVSQGKECSIVIEDGELV